MSDSTLLPLPGSHREPVQGAQSLGPAAPEAPVRLTVQLRPRDPDTLAARVAANTPYNHDEWVQAHAPTEESVAAVRAYLETNGLTVEGVSPDRRVLTVTGTVAAAERAFSTQLHSYEAGGQRFHARSGSISVPAGISNLIEGVFGLDTRPFARPHLVGLRDQPEAPAQIAGLRPLTALDVAQAYGFPPGDGTGQTIGIVELGGGFQDADLQAYFSGLNLPVPQVLAVSVNGGANNPTVDQQADGEVDLDIEVSGAVAPGARIVVYFARDTSEQSFVDSLNAVVNDTTYTPSIVSISWGGPELEATASARSAMDSALQAAASLGITVFAAAGDNGSADRPGATSPNVDYPAASPFVTACGGTALCVSNGAIASEVVWNEGSGHGATGGGISAVYGVPPWQRNVPLPSPAGQNGITPATGRGVPDVAGNADPFSGYLVQVDGRSLPIGGTSAVAPLWAGLLARINQAAGKRAGFINPALYAAGGRGFHDITDGNNAIAPVPGYNAGPGWDACTGWGSPDGSKIGAVISP